MSTLVYVTIFLFSGKACSTKVSTGNISLTFSAIDDLLKNEIDVLMLHFQFSNLEFYQEYRNARSIVGYNGGGKGGTTTEEPSK